MGYKSEGYEVPSRTKGARRTYAQEQYAKRKASGNCVYCGVTARPGGVICQGCQDESIWKARKRKYGIERDEFYALLEKQDQRCAICSVLIDESAHVDHDHRTQDVRGLLCGHCNRGIGCFRDNPEALEMAAEYLRGER